MSTVSSTDADRLILSHSPVNSFFWGLVLVLAELADLPGRRAGNDLPGGLIYGK